ncbi:pyridoxal phosphate phosphatase PHOSPHO2-like isoform X2 [Oratosquilla oratoria]
MAAQKVLVALDFDHTIIDDNSDTYIVKLLPNHKVPEDLKQLYRKDGWTLYMQEIFKLLHKNDTKSSQILNCLTEIKLTESMKEFLTKLPRDSTEFIVISDSNSLFIDHILRNEGIRDLFREIFTNPAKIDENDCLNIEMFHYQDYCKLSTKNLCKGHILNSYVESRQKDNVHFSHIAYVGDGSNDFCPSLLLKEKDAVFPRSGYSLLNCIPRMEAEKGLKVEAEVCPWDNGMDIHEKVKEWYSAVNENLPHPRLRTLIKT